jgi:hypothetical protein
MNDRGLSRRAAAGGGASRAALPWRLERFEVGGEIAAILRRRAGALAGVDVAVVVDPPSLVVRTAAAELLRRTLSLTLSALATRPALARLEVVGSGFADADAVPRLRISARARVGNVEERDQGRFQLVERRLLARAEALAARQRGLLLHDDWRPGELRVVCELAVVDLRASRPAGPGCEAGAAVVFVGTDEAQTALWGRALAAHGVAVERCASFVELLGRCEPAPTERPAPGWVVLDGSLVAARRAALAPLVLALAGAGVPAPRVAIVDGALGRETPVEPSRAAVRHLPAPVLLADLLAFLGATPIDEAAPDRRDESAPRPADCDADARSHILAADRTVQPAA